MDSGLEKQIWTFQAVNRRYFLEKDHKKEKKGETRLSFEEHQPVEGEWEKKNVKQAEKRKPEKYKTKKEY